MKDAIGYVVSLLRCCASLAHCNVGELETSNGGRDTVCLIAKLKEVELFSFRSALAQTAAIQIPTPAQTTEKVQFAVAERRDRLLKSLL